VIRQQQMNRQYKLSQ